MIFLSNCSKKDNVELNDKIQSETGIQEFNLPNTEEMEKITYDNLIEKRNIKYVNSPEGLRVRRFPDLNSEIIGLLSDGTKVTVLHRDRKNVNIDGINGRWAYVTPENDYRRIDGWVFNGYLKNINNEKSIYSKKSDFTIEEIWEYIFNDLNIKHRFNSIDEMLLSINLPENYIIKESTGERGWTLYYYDIEWNGVQLSYVTSDYIDYHLIRGMEIEITDNNYLHLFPYINIEGYIEDEDFGDYYVKNNELLYFINEHDGGTYDYSCSLIFNNGLLKTIIIVPYTT
jgi:hypothetical protein